MPITPEDRAREKIDGLLGAAGWVVQDWAAMDLTAGPGVAVREFPLKQGHGKADYLLYVNRRAVGVVEAKKEGETLTGVEVQTEKYSHGLPDTLKAVRRPLPWLYQSTGVETRFTNLLDPDAVSRELFTFHRPETILSELGLNGLSGLSDFSDGAVREDRESIGGGRCWGGCGIWGNRPPRPLDWNGRRFQLRTVGR